MEVKTVEMNSLEDIAVGSIKNVPNGGDDEMRVGLGEHSPFKLISSQSCKTINEGIFL